jgi:hypothetical protein
MKIIVMERTFKLLFHKDSKIAKPTRMEECNGERYMVYEIE